MVLDPAARADVGDPAMCGVRYWGSCTAEKGVPYSGRKSGMGMGVSIGSRGGSAGQRAVNAPGHGRVVRSARRGNAAVQKVKCGAERAKAWLE